MSYVLCLQHVDLPNYSLPDQEVSIADVQQVLHKLHDRENPLVVLSACQTGLGQTHDAGTIGLARAFQIAGTNEVVMSLWNVDDAATASLMNDFMKHLDCGRHVPAALRQAMLKPRSPGQSIDKWAPFTVFTGALRRK